MGSTFWAELYFRSLKTSSVFPILTKYLLRHKHLYIPHVGRFEILQTPAQLNVAEKEIIPPAYQTTFSAGDEMPPAPVKYVAAWGAGGESSGLSGFGEKLRRQIQASGFQWKGLGTFSFRSGQINFKPDNIALAALQPIPAQKVLRENVQHHVLVGDQEVTSEQVISHAVHVPKKRRPWFITAGWLLLGAAVIAVAVFLYLKHFQTTSTGMQVRW